MNALHIDASRGVTLDGLVRALGVLSKPLAYAPKDGVGSGPLFAAAAGLLADSGVTDYDSERLRAAAGMLEALALVSVTSEVLPLARENQLAGVLAGNTVATVEPEGAALIAAAASVAASPVMSGVQCAGEGEDVRLYLGRLVPGRQEHGNGELVVLEANIDDMSAELLAGLPDRLVEAGALDAWLTPALMKKGRPAHLISALCASTARSEVEEAVFTHSSTLGVRAQSVARTVLDREFAKVQTPWGGVTVKIARLRGKVVNVAPEFEDCKALAARAGVSVKELYRIAAGAFSDNKG